MARSLIDQISHIAREMGDAEPHLQEKLDLMTGGGLPKDGHGRAYFPRLRIFGDLGGRYVDHQDWEGPVATDASGFSEGHPPTPSH